MKILIVENDTGKRERVVRILEKNHITDYHVVKFVEEALAIATNEFDFLITDLGLPQSKEDPKVKGKNGFKMLLELAKREIRIPTIIYSFSLFLDTEKQELKKLGVPFIVHVVDDAVLEYFLMKEVQTKKSG